MPRLFLPCFLLVATAHIAAAEPKIINHETKGNLESTQEIGCIGLDKVTNTMTPADLYLGMATCLNAGDSKSAAGLFLMAGLYGRFDSLRVADPTAPQGITVLQMQHLNNQSADRKKEMNVEVQNLAKAKLASACDTVRRIGPPNYHPAYMVQHGMRAFEGDQPNKGLKPDVNANEIWLKALDTYLHCPAK